jgi:MFS family permease
MMQRRNLISLPRFHRNVWIVTVTSLLTDVSTEMISNLQSLFVVNVLGQRTAIVGLIDGVAETTASLVKIFSGQLSDRLGRRKSLAVLGYGISSIAKPFLYFASSWALVFGVRFADRVGKGIRTAPRDALLAGSIKADQRGLAFGLHRAGDTAGAFIGLAIGALIIWRLQSSAVLLARQTFQSVVLASIIPAFLAVIVLAVGAREMKSSDRVNELKLPLRLGWKDLDLRFRQFLKIMFLFTLGNSSDSFILLRGQERGLNVIEVIGMALTFNAIYTVLSGPAGFLSDKIGRRRIILAGWGIYALVYLGLAISRTGVQVWLCFGVYGVYYAFTEGIAKALIADWVPAEQRGTAYGYFNAVIGITALPASALAGILWQGVGSWTGFGPAAPFFFGGVTALLAGIWFARVSYMDRLPLNRKFSSKRRK